MFRTRSSHIILFTLLGLLTMAGMWSCRKDVEEFRPYPASLADLDPLLAQVSNPAGKTTFTLSGLIPDTVLTTPAGVRIFLTDTEHLFSNTANAPVPCSSCQTVKIELSEILRKSDMLARHIPGVSTDNRVIVSGGMVLVTVYCDGQILQLLPGRSLKIQIPNTIQQNDLLVFNGVSQNGALSAWENTGESVYLADWISTTTGQPVSGYEVIATQTGWVNCGHFLDEPTSSFCAQLPVGFSDVNTEAFLVFENMLAVVPLSPNADGSYCFDNAPKGYLVRIVTVSKLGGSYWLGNKQTEIGTNATVDLAPQIADEQQVVNFLKNL